MGMLAQDDPQEVPPYFSKQWRIGTNNQALSNGSDTSGGEAGQTLDFNGTEPTGTKGGKFRVVTKRGDVDIGLLGCLQYGRAFLCPDLQAINLELDGMAHVGTTFLN